MEKAAAVDAVALGRPGLARGAGTTLTVGEVGVGVVVGEDRKVILSGIAGESKLNKKQ